MQDAVDTEIQDAGMQPATDTGTPDQMDHNTKQQDASTVPKELNMLNATQQAAPVGLKPKPENNKNVLAACVRTAIVRKYTSKESKHSLNYIDC